MTIDLLTPREKECLRLLLYPMRPKDIARALGISVHTVNGHLKEARRKLRATDSLSAAQMLRDAEASLKIGEVNNSGSAIPGVQGKGGDADAGEIERGGGGWEAPFATRRRPWNDLQLRWRIAWPLMLFFLVALGVSALSSGAQTLSDVYLSLSRPARAPRRSSMSRAKGR